jgi:Zn-dependent protease
VLFLLQQGAYEVFILLIIALILSLSFHEFGHAIVAKWQGDDTAERAGRLTINPLAHIDPFGLLMVVMVGFGYAKPVPVDPRNYKSRYSDLWVSAAGPFMNLLVAFVAWNGYLIMLANGIQNPGMDVFFRLLTQINLLLMLFNLLPIGPLDGHYIFPYFLPDGWANRYRLLNARYGTILLLGLVALSFMGVPVFQSLLALAGRMAQLITLVPVS